MKKIILLGFVFLMFSVNVFATINDAYVSYSFDDVDTDGTTAYDTSGTNQHGTINGATTGVSGLVDSAEAYDFDGTNDNVNIGDIDFSGSNRYTFAFWAKVDNTALTGDILSDRTADSANQRTIEAIQINNKFFLRTGWSDGTNSDLLTASTISAGTWYHLAGTYDGSTVTLYLNGAVSNSVGVSKTLGTGTNPFLVGERSASRWFNGQVDQVMIWNDRALSSTEISDLYASGAGVNPYPAFSGGASPSSYFTVTTQDDETFTPLTNISVLLANGSVYTNSSQWVQLPFNDSSLQNFTVSLFGSITGNPDYEQGTNTIYWNITYTNWNTSFDLQSNHTQYPYLNATSSWTNESLYPASIVQYPTFGACVSGTVDFTDSGCSFGMYRNGLFYVPLNSTYNNYLFIVEDYNQIQYGHTWQNSNDLNLSFWQSQIKFNATQIITGGAVTGASYTIDGVTKTEGSYFYLNAGEYNVTFSKTGYNNKTVPILVNVSDVSQTITIKDVGSDYLNIYVRNLPSNNSVSSFTVYINNTNYSYYESHVAVGSVATLTIAQNVPITITVDPTGYQIKNVSITPTGSTNYTVYVYTTNSIGVELRDEVTRQLIDTTEMKIEVVGSYQALNETTTNGTIYFDLLTPDEYEIRYYSNGVDDYKLRSKFVTVEDRSFQNVVLYSLNTSTAVTTTTADITFVVYDENLDPLEGALVKVQRYYISSNGFVDVWNRKTNSKGEAIATLETVDAFYKYIVVYNDAVLYSSSNSGTQFNQDSTIPIFVNTRESVYQKDNILNGVSYTFSHVSTGNTTGYFSLEYDSSQQVQICVEVTNNNKTINDDDCDTGTSGNLQITYNVTHKNVVLVGVAKARLSSDDVYTILSTKQVVVNQDSVTSSALWKALGIFIAILVILFLVFAAEELTITASLILIGITIFVLTIPPFLLLPLPLSIVGWIVVLAIMIGGKLNK